MNSTQKSYLFLGVVAGTIVLIDQITKALVRAYIPINGYWPHWDWLTPYVRFYRTENTGVAFGMLQGSNVIFAILAILVSIAIIYYYPRVTKDDWTLRVALSLQLAGAVGNLIDRIVFGEVTDFISVGNFAVFNVADSSITIGVAILILGVWLQERKKTKSEMASVSEARGGVEDGPIQPDEANQ